MSAPPRESSVETKQAAASSPGNDELRFRYGRAALSATVLLVAALTALSFLNQRRIEAELKLQKSMICRELPDAFRTSLESLGKLPLGSVQRTDKRLPSAPPSPGESEKPEAITAANTVAWHSQEIVVDDGAGRTLRWLREEDGMWSEWVPMDKRWVAAAEPKLRGLLPSHSEPSTAPTEVDCGGTSDERSTRTARRYVTKSGAAFILAVEKWKEH